MRRAILAATAAAFVLATAHASAAPTLSTTNRLDDRRYVAAGEHAYVVGAESGLFPATGWHTRGEMGGIWTPPLKLLDGIWFGIDGKWLGQATKFSSGYGYVKMALPDASGVSITRTDFVPDARRGALVGLTLKSSKDRTIELTADAHSELMGAYPWAGTTPTAKDFNDPDSAKFDGSRLVFSDARNGAAAVGTALTPTGGKTGKDFRGPQDPAVICPADGTTPARCDDSLSANGAGGELTYELSLRGGSARTVWFGVAGSDADTSAAKNELAKLLKDPSGELADKMASRQALAGNTQLSLPGDPLLAQGIDWSKQNLADLTQQASSLQVRKVDQGKSYPAPVGTVPRVRFFGAGFPDYPWLFATDGEYTAFAAVGVGQFKTIEDHLRALRDVSDILNDRSGKVVHEVVSDGSVYFGSNDDPGNTDETVKFPSAVALVWRWTGDDSFRDEMYDFAKRNMQYVTSRLDADGDLWPEGSGNVEREGMGPEKLDNAVYAIRGLRDLAAMAQSKGDTATADWASSRASSMEAAFESTWWMPGFPQHADSLAAPGNVQQQGRFWIGVTPMEAELYRDGQPVPGVTTADHGAAALGLRETSCYSSANGLFHTGASGCDPGPASAGERVIFTLGSAVMAVGEGNYGRLDQQKRFNTANRALQLPSPDEQPGAMPEEAPAPDYGRSIDRPFYDRAMVMQAWGAYGPVWTVVHQQLGVRPDLGNGALEVTPQLPPGQSSIAGKNIRLGNGSVDVSATGTTTVVNAHLKGVALTIGHTLPAGATVKSVKLDGADAPYTIRDTNRGREVLVKTTTGAHTLEVGVE